MENYFIFYRELLAEELSCAGVRGIWLQYVSSGCNSIPYEEKQHAIKSECCGHPGYCYPGYIIYIIQEACDHVRKCRNEVLPHQTFLDQLSVWESDTTQQRDELVP